MTAAEHWLWRLDAGAWLRAAEVELRACEAHITSRRTAVTHARRAAGMAVNAVLTTLTPDDELRWGRSYLEHLQALTRAETSVAPLPDEVRPAAARLLAVSPLAPTGLVALGRGPHAAADETLAAARKILEACTAAVACAAGT